LHPLLERISIDPRVCFGKPIIRGTRIWVSLILDLLVDGMTPAGILEEYPQLTAEDIRAAIAYGALKSREQADARSIAIGSEITIRPRTAADDPWIKALIKESWGAEMVFVHGTSYRPAALPGFVAVRDGAAVGLVTYTIANAGDACEIVTLDSLREGQGIGSALVEAVRETARRAGCSRLWLITTNDNTRALRFYQQRGFRLVAVHRDAVDKARKFKPQIPMTGDDNIPIRDEIELEIAPLAASRT